MASISLRGQNRTTGVKSGVEGRLWERGGLRVTHTSCWNLRYHPSASGGDEPVTLHRQIPRSLSKCARQNSRPAGQICPSGRDGRTDSRALFARIFFFILFLAISANCRSLVPCSRDPGWVRGRELLPQPLSRESSRNS